VRRRLRPFCLLPASAACALAAHALVYRSFFPSGSAHRYLAWYEPVAFVLTLGSLAALVGIAALAAAGRSLPWRIESASAGDLWARVAAGGVLLFLLQESLERSLSGGAGVATLSAGTWLAVLAAVGALAALVALVTRSGLALARLALRRSSPRPRGGASCAPYSFAPPRRRSPLAERRGLRAPPLLAA
jgi:hypothetical protein